MTESFNSGDNFMSYIHYTRNIYITYMGPNFVFCNLRDAILKRIIQILQCLMANDKPFCAYMPVCILSNV